MSKWRGYTKEDLLWIIEYIETDAPRGCYWTEKARTRLQQAKDYARIREAEKWGQIADDKLKEYRELLAPYEDKHLSVIPQPILAKAIKLLEEYEAANKKYLKMDGVT